MRGVAHVAGPRVGSIVFLVLAAALITRFVRTGGLAMLRMMGGSPDGHEHDHADAHASHPD